MKLKNIIFLFAVTLSAQTLGWNGLGSNTILTTAAPASWLTSGALVDCSLTLSVQTSGSGYSTASFLPTTGGTGSGLLVSITASGTISAATTVGFVTAYAVNDIVTVVQSGGSAGTLKVTAISAKPYCTGTTQFSTGAGTVSGSTYPYLSQVKAVIQAQSGCAPDTVHSLLICTGGGHTDYIGNQIYVLDPFAATIKRYTDPSGNPATGSAGPLNNPSTQGGQVNPDGTAPSTHTQQQIVYLPNENWVYKWAIGVAQNGTPQTIGWIIDMNTSPPTWIKKSTVPDLLQAGANIILDTTSPTESVLIFDWLNNTIYRYAPTTDTYTEMPGGGGIGMINGGTCAINPLTAIVYCAGAIQTGSGGAPAGVATYPLTGGSAYTYTAITGTLTGCTGLYSVSSPGFKWDSASSKFVGYTGTGNSVTVFDPVALSCSTVTNTGGPSNPVADTYGIYNDWAYFPSLGQFAILANATDQVMTLTVDSAPGAGTAPTITVPFFPNGNVGTAYSFTIPTIANPSPTCSVTTGTLPAGLSLSSACVLSGTPTTMETMAFTVTVTNGTSPNAVQAYSMTITGPGTNGLGGSTLTCLDRDGDGYGVGPGCTGPDADDLDATIQTGPQAVTRYGTLAAFLIHRGYNPTHIWYLAPASPTAACLANGGTSGQCTGSDSNSCEDNINAPCLTGAHIQASVTSGMMVLFRDGLHTRFTVAGSGTATAPIVFLAYPGEQPIFDATSATNYLIALDRAWITIDGIRGQNNGGIQAGDSTAVNIPHTFHDDILRKLDMNGPTAGGTQALGPIVGIQNLTIEDSVLHDTANFGGGQAGVYIGSGCTNSTGATAQRIITYNNGYAGFHVNGYVTNLIVQNLLSYDNQIEGIAFESGVNNSIVQSSVSFNNLGADFELYNYKGSGGSVTACTAGYYTVTGATWSSGTATLTVTPTNTEIVGENLYVSGVIPSGYNCLGVGCVITAQTSSTISYTTVINSNPGTYSSGGFAEVGVGDQSGNTIRDNTFYQGSNYYSAAIWTNNICPGSGNINCTPGTVTTGNLGGNTFTNNIAVNYGDTNSTFRYAPIAFNNGPNQLTPTYLASDIFNFNITQQANGINGGIASYGLYNSTCSPTCSAMATYSAAGAIANGGPALSFTTGSIANGLASDPKFTAAPPTSTTASAFNFQLTASSPALHAGTTGGPTYDLVGNVFAGTPSMGAYEYTNSTPAPPGAIFSGVLGSGIVGHE